MFIGKYQVPNGHFHTGLVIGPSSCIGPQLAVLVLNVASGQYSLHWANTASLGPIQLSLDLYQYQCEDTHLITSYYIQLRK